MLLWIQLIGILFALIMLYFTFVRRKRGEFTAKEWIVWMVVWIAFIFVTIFPLSLEPIIRTLSISRPLDLLVIIGFLFLITVGFHTYSIMRATQKKVEDIVRKVAFDTADNIEKDKEEEKSEESKK